MGFQKKFTVLLCVCVALREIIRVQKLGKNHGGYHGQTIDIRAVLHDVKAAAQAHGWASEMFYKTGDLELLALHRKPEARSQKPEAGIYISTGIHGDEPAGPLAALKLIQENNWPPGTELWLLPCLNPSGFVLNSRESADGRDLNRDYRHLETAEVAAHIRWLERQANFDVTFCLHEDWESHGFYIYELNPDHRPSLAAKMIEAVARVCPIDLSPVIEGREAKGGIINPNLDPASRPQWPEAFWLVQYKTRRSYTLEAPSDFPLATRVNALVAGVNAALKS
ncbi:MAG: M14 family metallocarboxypeptidase [Verrucomicrobiales bacterium]|nr:M14 family metallocarboxypeptidase [Verrucomicrobiales bacterium]